MYNFPHCKHPTPKQHTFTFWPWCRACRIFVPWPEIKPVSPALESWNRNHWTAREVPKQYTFYSQWTYTDTYLSPKLHRFILDFTLGVLHSMGFECAMTCVHHVVMHRVILLPQQLSVLCPFIPPSTLTFCCCCSVAQSCPALCNSLDCSTPGLPVHHHPLELAQTHVHWVRDAIQPSRPLSSPSPPAFNLSQHQGLF